MFKTVQQLNFLPCPLQPSSEKLFGTNKSQRVYLHSLILAETFY